MSEELFKEIYYTKKFNAHEVEQTVNFGKISDKDKFLAAKQILLGLAILYVLTLVAFLIRPNDSTKLMDICMTIFPPLATLILVSYFKDKS